MSKALVGMTLAVMLLDVVGLAFMFFPPASQSTNGLNSSFSSFSSTPASANQTSTMGLMLSATLNSTEIRQGDAIGVTAELVNTREDNLTLYPDFVTYSNVTAWGPYSTNECNSQSILAIAVFKGNYTSDNISRAGDPLQLAEPFAIPCAAPLTLTRVTLLLGSHAAEEFTFMTGSSWSEAADLVFTLSPFKSVISTNGQYTEGSSLDGAAGYYTGGYSAASFHQFPAGSYTVVIADVWRQTLMLYFGVV